MTEPAEPAESTEPAEPADLSTTRASYDGVVVLYAELFSNSLDAKPIDRALLAAFAERVQADADSAHSGGDESTGNADGNGATHQAAAFRVADLGCGPGHVTAYLRSLGLDAFGLDLSPAMVALAREAYPELRFVEGSIEALELADGSLGGVVSRYSVIHTPPERLPAVFGEFHRVLAPGGHLMPAFQAHDEPAGPPRPFDHKVAPAYRWSPGQMAELLSKAGFHESARFVREPDEGERFLQACLLARKPRTPKPKPRPKP